MAKIATVKQQRLFFCALFAISALFASLTAVAAADFTIQRDQPFPDHFVGFGAQFNGWVYAFPNTGVGGTNEETAKVLEEKIIALRPQHVRIFTEPNPHFRQSEPIVKASILRTFQLAQRAGATINATHWHGPHRDPGKSAQNMVNMLDEFINQHGLNAIKYVTLQNEPNLFGMDMQRYNTLYLEFDARLRKAGLRERIKIIGGDLLRDNQHAWFKNLDENLADVLDGYSVHMYADYWDTKHVVERVAEIPPIIAALRPEARKPLYVMEFGFRGKRRGMEEPGRHESGAVISDLPLYGLLCGWRMMEALNRGYVALVHWDAYDAWYDRIPMQYGLLGPAREGWRERPHYHLFRMFTHTAGPGWQSLKIAGQREQALVSAMTSPAGEFTIYVMNRAQQPVTISVTGAPESTTFQQLIWNAASDGTLTRARNVVSDEKGLVAVELPPQGIAALTTAAVDRLE